MSRTTCSILAAVLVVCGCGRNRPVGFLGELSGAAGELAVMGRDAARLFVEEHGSRLVVCDTRNDPDTTSRCVERLADSGAVVILGPMTSRNVDSAIAAASRTGTVLVSPTVSSHLLSGKDDALLRVIGSNLDQADALAAHLVATGRRRPLVFWERKNAVYSRALVGRILEKMGLSDSLGSRSIGYTTGTDLSFDSIVARHPEADAYVIAGSAMDAALLCRGVRRSGSVAPVLGSQFAMGSDLLRIGGPDAEGMVLAAAQGFAIRTPERDAFRRAFQGRFLREPSFGAFFAWEAASVSLPGWNAPDGERAKRAILSTPPSSPLGEPLRLDAFGDVQRRIVLHEVVHGDFQALP